MCPSAIAQVIRIEEADEKSTVITTWKALDDFQPRYGRVMNMHAHVLVK